MTIRRLGRQALQLHIRLMATRRCAGIALLICDISVPASHLSVIVYDAIIIHVFMNIVKFVRVDDTGMPCVRSPCLHLRTR